MIGGSAELVVGGGQKSQLSLAGSYLYFRKLDTVDPRIRRQNTLNLAGLYVFDYRVVDIHAGIVSGGQVPFVLSFDYAWNTAVDENNKGLWLQVAMGQLEISRAWIEYTYAKIDRDATVAAFNADDFFWGTGYQAHRIDIGAATGKGTRVEVSMLESMYFTLCSEFAAYHSTGELPVRASGRSPAGAAPYGRYRCQDGWIAIICVAESHWQIGRASCRERV